MESDPEIGFWRTDYHTVNGFRQFCRDWQPREESCLPVLALAERSWHLATLA